MLILARRAQQTVVFPELDIVVHVLETQGKTTKIGIEAGPTVTILRGELIERRMSLRQISTARHDPKQRVSKWLNRKQRTELLHSKKVQRWLGKTAHAKRVYNLQETCIIELVKHGSSSISANGKVLLEKEDGKMIQISIDKLSDEDQAVLQSHR